MAFRFSLETVLRLREIAEQREERAMQAILRNMAQQRQELITLAAHRERLVDQCAVLLRAKTSAAELLLLQGQIQATADLEAQGRKHLAHIEEQRQAQMRIYETAHRDREVLSNEKQQQAGGFKRVQARREQMEMDNVFSSRRTRTESRLKS